jgi:hypothetical protein
VCRAFWAFALQRFPGWRQRLVIVKPETVIAWHRQAFRLFWRRKSQAGRPRAHAEVRRLVRQMAIDNPTWGALRIHGELLKLGFEVSERTVSRYLERIRPEPRRTGSQIWSTFLRSQAKGILAVDLFTVPTIGSQSLYVFVVLALGTPAPCLCERDDEPNRFLARPSDETSPRGLARVSPLARTWSSRSTPLSHRCRVPSVIRVP